MCFWIQEFRSNTQDSVFTVLKHLNQDIQYIIYKILSPANKNKDIFKDSLISIQGKVEEFKGILQSTVLV